MSLHPEPAALLAEVNARLALALPEPVCELDHDDAWQLLIVTILSAQARDAVINTIRPALFERWPTPADLANAELAEVEVVVKNSGYFRQKAKAIVSCAKDIVDKHGGEVPRTHEELIALQGASHKTANLVLGIAFGIPSGIVVDTHVARVSERLGLVKPKQKPPKIEARLCGNSDKEDWIDISHRLILHGRHVCKAKQPDCASCAINELCPEASAAPLGDWRERAEAEGRLFAVRGDRAAAGWASSSGGGSKQAKKSPASASSSAALDSSPAPASAPQEDEDDF